MAEHDEHVIDMREHNQTYEMFLWLTKWFTIAVAVVLILLAIFLV